MRWPWVSRWRADYYMHQASDAENARGEFARNYHELTKRYDALLDKYHALKMQGAAPVPAAPTVVPPRAKDAVLEAIATVAGSNAALRTELGKYARQARAGQVSDDEIIENVYHWPEDDEGVPA